MANVMTRFRSASVACVSALVLSGVATGARPQYGGTLRLAVEGTPRTLDPALPADPATARRILPLLFETLTTVEPGETAVIPRLF